MWMPRPCCAARTGESPSLPTHCCRHRPAAGLLPGHPQFVLFTCQLIALRLLWSLVDGNERPHLPRALGYLALSILVMLLLTAAQLYPSLEVIHESIRGVALTADEIAPRGLEARRYCAQSCGTSRWRRLSSYPGYSVRSHWEQGSPTHGALLLSCGRSSRVSFATRHCSVSSTISCRSRSCPERCAFALYQLLVSVPPPGHRRTGAGQLAPLAVARRAWGGSIVARHHGPFTQLPAITRRRARALLRRRAGSAPPPSSPASHRARADAQLEHAGFLSDDQPYRVHAAVSRPCATPTPQERSISTCRSDTNPALLADCDAVRDACHRGLRAAALSATGIPHQRAWRAERSVNPVHSRGRGTPPMAWPLVNSRRALPHRRKTRTTLDPDDGCAHLSRWRRGTASTRQPGAAHEPTSAAHRRRAARQLRIRRGQGERRSPPLALVNACPSRSSSVSPTMRRRRAASSSTIGARRLETMVEPLRGFFFLGRPVHPAVATVM